MLCYLISLFFYRKLYEDCDILSWGFFNSTFQPQNSNCFKLTNSVFLNIVNEENGGSIYLENKNSNFNICSCSFVNSISSKSGGSIFLDIRQSNISNCCFNNCSSKLSASSIFVRTQNNMVNNLLSESAITFCSCNASTVQLIQGQQVIFSVNISNNQVESTGSAISVKTESRQRISLLFLHSASNVGQFALDLQYSDDVSLLQASNFVNNTNREGYISRSSGQWDIKKCIFALNHGNLFVHEKDELQLFDCLFDTKIDLSKYGKSIHTRNITVQTNVALNELKTNFNGFCPAEGTPTHPMPSPTPAQTVLSTTKMPLPSASELLIQPSQTVELTLSQSETLLPIDIKKPNFLSFMILPAKILFAALIFFVIFSLIIKPDQPQNEDDQVMVESVGQQIVGPIEMSIDDGTTGE